jgi:C4-dicarboxylate-specific signal transduction histidine kinase
MLQGNFWPRLSRARPCQYLVGTAVGLLVLAATAAQGQAEAQPPLAERVLTNIAEIWEIPRKECAKPHRIKTEVVVYFFDAAWRNASGECQGRPTWLPIADAPVPLKPGQRVAIDGVIIPRGERFLWDRTQIRVLEEGLPLVGETVTDPGKNPQEFKNHLVTLEGLIDGHVDDPTHFKLAFLSGNTLAMMYVVKGTNSAPPHFQDGDFVRAKGIFVPQFDRNGNLSDLSLAVATPADVEVIGSLKTDPRFLLPITPSEDVREDKPSTELLHVAGNVRNHEPGKWVTIWDATGAVMVESKQSQPLRVGDRVEAIGYPYVQGVQQCLHRGLYREAGSTNQTLPTEVPGPGQTPLRLAGRIRDLSSDEASRQLPVSLRAVVTWSHPTATFAYVEDASGGVRVMNPRWENGDTLKPGTIVILEGITSEGEFVPVVTNSVLRRVGWWNIEPGQLVSLEQALTGLEDGRWVEMGGFVRAVTRTNGMTRLDLSTSSGEYPVWTPATQSFDWLKGTIIRVQGVCAARSNARRQLTGIQMWVPDDRYIRVEETAPEDLFALPLRSLEDLRRFSLQNALNRRVRTSGTVVLHAPGRYLYLQDGSDSVFALSHQTDPLQPGDSVEVVGFPGNEGRRFLLREAAYRKTAAGTEPAPVQLSTLHSVNLDLEGLLARAEGTLLNAAEKNGETRLLIQTADSTFEANVNSLGADSRTNRQALQLGSRLALTGVYEVPNDEYGQPRSFLLHLRSWNDVQLLQLPPWWTAARLLWMLLGVLFVFLLAMAWALMISRKNGLLQQAQTELRLAHDKLELRVEERTKELASSLSLLNATLEATVDGILVVGQDGVVTSHNTKFSQMWRLPSELVESKNDRRLLEFVVAQLRDSEAFLGNVRQLYANPEAESFDTLEFRDGRVFERYSQPQRLGDRCVGRVWCFRDVTERERAKTELERAHRQLVQTSRQVGMAEVATSVLHNVGNVLNSVNVSATLIQDRLRRSPAANLARAAEMLEHRSSDLAQFLTLDPKGSKLQIYLKELAHALDQERQCLRENVESLTKNVDHIKAIVAMQQSYARVGGAFEELDPRELMEDATLINCAAFERDQIQLVREYQPVPRVTTDRHKVLQILINLFSNARDALAHTQKGERRVFLSVSPGNSGRVCFRVKDNGLGIEAQNLNRIFSQGFTTKKHGHGFGLHGSAIAASELNGSLSAQSDGYGHWAVFTLELPAARA